MFRYFKSRVKERNTIIKIVGRCINCYKYKNGLTMKKTVVIVLTLIVSFISLLTNAQTTSKDSIKAVYERESILLDGTTNSYVKQNQKKKIGIFGKKLSREFENSSADAKQEIDAFSKGSKSGIVYLASGVVVIAVAAALMPEITIPVYVGLTSVGLIPYSVGIVKMVKASRHLMKAIWLHNRDVLLK